nr:MAG TPA: hypothetical protein [Caudoviricetes sp.]
MGSLRALNGNRRHARRHAGYRLPIVVGTDQVMLKVKI